MPAKSQQQMKFIYANRSKYGSKRKAPKNMKWIFDEEWTSGVKMKKLPKTVAEKKKKKNESHIMDFSSFVLESETFMDFNGGLSDCGCDICNCVGECDCKCCCYSPEDTSGEKNCLWCHKKFVPEKESQCCCSQSHESQYNNSLVNDVKKYYDDGYKDPDSFIR